MQTSLDDNHILIAFEDAGGFRDIVIDDVSGYLVAYESGSELVEKITLICDDEELKERLEENAKKISGDYSFEDYISFLKIACRVEKFKVNEVNSLKNEISSLKKQNKRLKKQNRELLSSTSWKVTSPMRKSKHFIKKIFKD